MFVYVIHKTTGFLERSSVFLSFFFTSIWLNMMSSFFSGGMGNITLPSIDDRPVRPLRHELSVKSLAFVTAFNDPAPFLAFFLTHGPRRNVDCQHSLKALLLL